MKFRRHIATAAVISAGALVLAACGSSSSAGGSSAGSSNPKVTLALVAYSTPQAAYVQLIKAFQATPQGENVSFTQSYGASGDQSRAVAAGLTADVVNFALAPDITRLVKANLVAATWNSDQYKGMITDSVVVIGTRKGNPKNIKTWTDLIKPGVQVITANPFTSGGARWNIMAAYGAVSNKGADKAGGVAYLNSLFKNVPVQDSSARKALQTFTGGKGDAFLSYESEAIFAQANGQAVDYTVPDSDILIENPAAVTSTSKHPKEAKEFLDFLHTTAAQQIWATNGYRPVVAGVATGKFPTPANLFTIGDLGGWTQVTTDFFDPTTGIMADVEKSIGVTVTAK
jgi:sulfate/thiosulfate transport system substrate-binding protein